MIVKRKKYQIFKVALILSPLVLFAFIEGILRIFNWGNTYPLVIKHDQSDFYSLINPEIGYRYFSRKEFLPVPQYDLFLTKKSLETFRIVVQGESTSAGFPYFHGGAFPRMLEHKLQMRFPKKNIEVINVSLTATNSYTVRDLSDEIVELKPDLIIIMSGHNEFYGALGTASHLSIGQSQLLTLGYLKLGRLRTFQLIRKLLKKTDGKASEPIETSLMEVMAQNKLVPLESNQYEKTISQFKSNLEATVIQYKSKNIPVILTTLISNFKDQEPFNYLAGYSSDSDSSYSYFEKGKSLLSFDPVKAKENFKKAKSWDEIRFRAPDEFNSIIDQLAKKHGLQLVDLVQEFEDRSPYGIIGNELLTEHVHPNVSGQTLIADVFIKNLLLLKFFSGWDTTQNLSQHSGPSLITEVDSVWGALQIKQLKTRWPFTETFADMDSTLHSYVPQTIGQQLALERYQNKILWVEALNKLYSYYSNSQQHTQALGVAQALAQEFTHLERPQLMCASSAQQLAKRPLELFYLMRAFEIQKSQATALKIIKLFIVLKDYKGAILFIDEHDTGKEIYQLREVISLMDTVEVQRVTQITDAHKAVSLGKSCILLGLNDLGIRYLKHALALNPNQPELRQFLETFSSKTK